MPLAPQYDIFLDWLSGNGNDRITLSFEEIEKIIGAELPHSAREYDAWWANDPSHSLPRRWLAAGYRAESHSLQDETLTLVRSGNGATEPTADTPVSNIPDIGRCFTIGDYEFEYLQDLAPELNPDDKGKVKEYRPHENYENIEGLPLLENGEGPFCRFSLKAGNWPGVYIWKSGDEILYIGETEDLASRFNHGYGHISPRNCYRGGRATNCRMNKVVLDYYNRGKSIQIYFFQTEQHKQVESELLRIKKTKYNIMNN